MNSKRAILVGAVCLLLAGGAFFAVNKKDNGFSNTEPMYGASNYEEYAALRGESLEKVDTRFVSGIVEKKGSKAEALKDATTLAMRYMRDGDTDTAMKRCNQAWLIDHESPYVSWCFGAVLGSKGDLAGSAVHFDQAVAKYSADAALTANDHLLLYRDAAQTYINLSHKYLDEDAASAKKYAERAIVLLSTSLKDAALPQEAVPVVKLMLALAHFNKGDYKSARTVYDELISAYPESTNGEDFERLDAVLKSEGF